jgi:hypothetical protein
MRVALITSWSPELCGIAANSLNLVNHMTGVDYTIIDRPFTHDRIMGLSRDCEIVHLNYERNLHVGVDPSWFLALRAQGKKTLVTFGNFWPGDHQDDAMISVFDAVVVQDDPKNNCPEKNWFYVPMGIMQVPVQTEIKPQIGTAGFPTYWKGGLIMAEVAEALALKFLYFAPISRHADALGMCREIEKRCRNCEFIHEFLPMEQIIWRLSECAFTCWLYIAHPQQSGVSGSVRLGLAARRPAILSRAGMYRDIFPYEDEIYFVNSDSVGTGEALPIAKHIYENLTTAKRPNRVIEEMNWTKASRMYRDIYSHLLGN